RPCGRTPGGTAWLPAAASVARLLLHLVGLDDVLEAQVVVAEADTALVALADLGGIVLEPAQRLHGEVVGDDHPVADEPRLGVAPDDAAADDRTRHVADPRDLEDLPDLRGAQLDLFVDRLEQALDRRLDLLDRLVDDRVVADVDAHPVGELAVLALRPDVEADDDGLRRRRQVDVVLRDRADAAADDADADLVAARVDLEQRLLQGLHGTGHVALDEQGELGALPLLQGLLPVLHGDPARRLRLLGEALARLALVGDLAGDPVVLDDQEVVAGAGHVGQAQHLHRPGRLGVLHVLAVLVEHGADAAVGVAADDRVADVERAPLHQHRGHGAAAAVEVGLDREALGLHARVGAQVQRGVGGQHDRLQQRVDVLPAQRGDVDELHVAAVLLGDQAVLGELGPDALRVGALDVDLVDRDHDRHLGRLGVVDGLGRLRLHAVVGRDHQHRDVGGLGTAGTHGGERLVARGVDEGDLALFTVDRGGHLVGADVLGDPAGLAAGDVAVPDGVQQLRLTVVDVAHHGDHRRTRTQVLVGAGVLAELDGEGLQQLAVLVLRADDADVVLELLAEQLQRLVGQRLGRGDHLAQVHHHLDQGGRVDPDL